MAKSEQRFHCQECAKTWTGIALEHCRSCHETFNNTRAGDKHTEVAFTYAAFKMPNGTIGKAMADEIDLFVALGGKLLSENNEMRYCLGPAGMRAKGMNQEKNGCWNSGGNWSPEIYKGV